MDQIKGLRVTVLRDSIQQSVLDQMALGFNLHVQILPADSLEEAFENTRQGQADAAVANHFFGDFSAASYGLEPQPLTFNAVMLFFASAEGRNADLLAAIDQHLRAWISTPQSPYYTSLSRWAQREDGRHKLQRMLYWALMAVLAGLAASGGIIWILNRQVAAKTAHLAAANTRLAESEQNLRLRNERMAFIIEGGRLGTWEWNVQTNETVFNSTWAGMLGYTIDELTPYDYTTWESLVHPDDLPAARERLMKCMNGAQPDYESEFRMRHKDGRWIWILDRGRVMKMDDSGKPLVTFGTHTDITGIKESAEERARLAQSLLQAQKLESVGRLAGGVAHDFNNLLMGIMGYVDLCSETLAPDHPAHEWLTAISTEANRSAAPVRQLLAFARKQTIQPVVLNANERVESMLGMLRRLIGENVQLEWTPSSDAPAICIDPGQLDQVLANLCVNARDAIDGTGRIKLRVDNIFLSPEDATP